MSDFIEEDITDLLSPWAPLLSPNNTLYDQTKNDQTFSQSNIQSDQLEQRSDHLGENLATRIDQSFSSWNSLISPRFRPSTLLQPEILNNFSHISPFQAINNKPLETIQGSGEDHATIIMSNNNVTDNQPMHLPLQQGSSSNVNNGNILDAGESSKTLKKSKKHAERSNIGAIRLKNSITIQTETEENNPDDGFHWKKYGQSPAKGNPNPRSYYKCTYKDCKVRKLVERGARDIKLLMVTYIGKHEHAAPAPGRSRSRTKKSYTDQRDHEMVMPPSRSLPPMDHMPPCLPLGPQNEMTQVYMSGLSNLPRLPVNQNLNYVHQPINHNLVMPHNDQVVNQNLSSLHQPLNMVSVHQNYHLANQKPEFVFPNDQPNNHQHVYRSDELNNENPNFVYQNDQTWF